MRLLERSCCRFPFLFEVLAVAASAVVLAGCGSASSSNAGAPPAPSAGGDAIAPAATKNAQASSPRGSPEKAPDSGRVVSKIEGDRLQVIRARSS